MTEDEIINEACLLLESMSPRPGIVWENRHWEGDDDVLLIVESVPGDTMRVSLNGTHSFPGIFQVTVRVAGNSGSDEALTVARRIQNLFYNTTLAGARVDHYPRRLSGYPDGKAHYRMPVQVRYQGYSKPA